MEEQNPSQNGLDIFYSLICNSPPERADPPQLMEAEAPQTPQLPPRPEDVISDY
jgi:flagellar motor protein MotB